MKSEAQKKAEMKYRREKVKQVVVTFSPFDYQSDRHCSKTYRSP